MSEVEIHSPEGAPPAGASEPPKKAPEAHEPEPPAELDRPRVGAIGVAIVLTLGLLAGVVIGVQELFRQAMTAEINAKVLSLPSSELRELRAEEEAKLTRYRWVSKKDGVVRIPLPRAVELTLADYRARSAQLDAPGHVGGDPQTPGTAATSKGN